jgi:hypothetical protein
MQRMLMNEGGRGRCRFINIVHMGVFGTEHGVLEMGHAAENEIEM